MSTNDTITTIHIPTNPPSADGVIYSYEVSSGDDPLPTYDTGTTIQIRQGDAPSPFEQAIVDAVADRLQSALHEYIRVVDGKVDVAMPLRAAEAANE
jgi:hypothetical protein